MKNSVNILGTKYAIKYRYAEDDRNLGGSDTEGYIDGYTDPTTKTIVVGKFKAGKGLVEGVENYMKKVLRHEITHAFLYESGLAESTMPPSNWAVCEEIVDWIALQGPKLHKAWEEAEAI